MTKSLLIVESPAKAKTIKKYLGKDFTVEASSGHLVDLPSNKLGVDVEKEFAPDYVVIKDKAKYLSKLKKASAKADNVYLASDPDREGEAIAWHIVDQLELKDKAQRVLFHEITEKAVKEALANPIKLSQDKFEAQQARRILDRLVGYQVSPLLWKKVKKGLSAGRVQSVALRLIAEREKSVQAFNSKEYWSVKAILDTSGSPSMPFTAQLIKFDSGDLDLPDEDKARVVVESFLSETFKVKSVERKPRTRKPKPPFITSTLQQEASSKIRFTVKMTMSVAQKLYEGLELGDEGPVGLITYMRTDSVRLADSAVQEAREFIQGNYGEKYLPKTPNRYKVKKSSQDAHEAIRPTSTEYPPKKVKKFLTKQQFALYELIWNRFLASQMTPAEYDQTTVEIEAGRGLFRANATLMTFPGFTAAYKVEQETENGAENGAESTEGANQDLPDLSNGEILKFLEIEGNQHFTKPPPRFTESSLVKELEDKGIGRPSTYAMIISTIQDREYVKREKQKLTPTLLGMSVVEILKQGFPEVMDIQFTAEMEESLDKVESGDVNWVELLKTFYKGFSERLEKAEDTMKSLRREGVATGISCDSCGSPMIIKWGKKGEFLSCSRYPACKNAKKFTYSPDGKIQIYEKKEPEIFEQVKCELCGKPMAIRMSRFGKFFGCTGYPECKGIRKLKDVEKELGEGSIITTASQDGRKQAPERKSIRIVASELAR